MKKTRMMKLITIVTAFVMILGLMPQFAVSAAYENTHVNTGNQLEDIIAVAETQNGYSEGSNNYTKYGEWYESNIDSSSNFSNLAWCAMFVSWCADQAGISSSILPRRASVGVYMNWFKNKGQWHDRNGYTPQRGDLMCLEYLNSKGETARHIGIVESCDGTSFITIEGNSSDQVKNVQYNLSNTKIAGFATPAYENVPVETHWYDGYTPIDIGTDFYGKIKSQYAGWCFTNNNGNVEGQYETADDNQIWKFERQTDGSYKIVSRSTGLPLEVADSASDGEGSNIQTGTDNSSTAQKFFFYEMFGAYYMRPVCSDLILDMDLNSYPGNVAVYGYGAEWTPMKFEIQKICIDGNLPVNIGDNFYGKIKSQYAGWCFTNNNGDVEGQYETADDNQIWKFERQTDGSYKIVSRSTGLPLEVADFASNGEGSNIQTGADNSSTAQRFFFYEMFGAYYMRPVCSDLILDMDLNSYPGNVAVYGYGAEWTPMKFEIQKICIDENLPVNIGDNFYGKIKSQYAGWCFTNNNGDVEGQYETADDNQIWKFERQTDGSYKIISRSTGLPLEVADSASNGEGSNIQTGADNSSTAQRFFFYEMFGAYYMRPVCSDLILDMDLNSYPGNVAVYGYGAEWAPMKFDIAKIDINNRIADLNQDTNITILDALLLQKHLLHLKALTSEQSTLADINQDGMVNVFDLCQLKALLQ